MTFVKVSGTIFSLSSGRGKSAVSVIRVSGPGAVHALSRMTRENGHRYRPRYMKVVDITHSSTGALLDKGMAVWFPGPKSFTGEDSCEFHIHGGHAVVSSVLDSLGKIPGFRPAEAGEFTRRAFINGKLDLTKVEGLADLLSAETELQHKLALRQVRGDLEDLYKNWRQLLIKCIANAEAYIDFAEDENIEDDVMKDVDKIVKNLTQEIEKHLSDNRRGERLREGVHVAIIGEPNVGKSSLMNLLCQRQAAIVSPIPGTTRDILETTIDIGGFPMILCDTAGLRQTTDLIEQEGVKRAKKRAEEADLVIFMKDASKRNTDIYRTAEGLAPSSCSSTENSPITFSNVVSPLPDHQCQSDCLVNTRNQQSFSREISVEKSSSDHEMSKVESPYLNDCENLLEKWKGEVMTVWNKIDLMEEENLLDTEIRLSCRTNEGVEKFVEALKERLSRLCADPESPSPLLTNARHRTSLEQCLLSLRDYQQSVTDESDLVISVQKLRSAVRCIGAITGEVYTDNVLDVIFSDFCIGK